MLARFKWLIAAAGFLIQYMVLPMLPGVSVYPDVALAAVCALGLIYGPGAGIFYGCCVGVMAGSLFTLSLARTALTYALLGLVCGFMSFKARSSRVTLPVITVGLCQIVRQAVDIVCLILARARVDTLTLLTRLTTSTVLTIICALPIYWLLYKSQYRYHVIGKRVGI